MIESVVAQGNIEILDCHEMVVQKVLCHFKNMQLNDDLNKAARRAAIDGSL